MTAYIVFMNMVFNINFIKIVYYEKVILRLHAISSLNIM